MANILYLETSTTICSVAVSINHQIVAIREIDDGYKHAELLTVFIEEVLKECNLKTSDLNYISLGLGPGSYTGLRISASVAKSLSFALNIPIIGVDSLSVIASGLEKELLNEIDFIIPMIDARRMEVYQCMFDKQLNRLTDIKPLILEDQSFLLYLNQGKCLFIGNSNDKAKTVIQHPNAIFANYSSTCKGLVIPTKNKIEAKEFLNTAYFEPIYLKQFGEK